MEADLQQINQLSENKAKIHKFFLKLRQSFGENGLFSLFFMQQAAKAEKAECKEWQEKRSHNLKKKRPGFGRIWNEVTNYRWPAHGWPFPSFPG